MDFEYSAKVKALQQRLHAFMEEHIYPNEQRYEDEVQSRGSLAADDASSKS